MWYVGDGPHLNSWTRPGGIAFLGYYVDFAVSGGEQARLVKTVNDQCSVKIGQHKPTLV